MSFVSQRNRAHRAIVCLLVVATTTMGNTGCSRRFWRQQAERDTYNAIGEKLNDRRWQLPRIDIKPDRRSRFFDPYDPDCEPLPPDDPAAHQFMHCVNGMKGYKSWHKLGTALSIENPQWLEPYNVNMQNIDPVNGHMHVSLLEIDLQDSVELSYIHSREYQTAIEELYLQALSLTLERFNLGVRFGGNGLAPPGFGLDYTDQAAGSDSVGVTPSFGVRQLLPSGAQIAVELANSTLWLFSGGNGSSASTLSYSLTQPLLREAGRKIVLEDLTQGERDVLYEARTLARFRQTLFARTASDYLQILLQTQSILNNEFNIRQLQEQIDVAIVAEGRTPSRVPGDLERFPEGVTIPDDLAPYLTYDGGSQTLFWLGPLTDQQEQALLMVSDDELYQAAAAEIIRWKRTEVVPLRVSELITQLNSSRSDLEDSRRALADQLDAFKITLGLPPDVELTIDDALLAPFQLISEELLAVETGFKDLAKQRGPSMIPDSDATDLLPAIDVDLTDIKSYAAGMAELQQRLAIVLQQVEADFLPIQSILEFTADDWSAAQTGSRYFNTPEERERVIEDVARDLRLYRSNKNEFELYSQQLAVALDYLEGDVPAERLDTNKNQRIDYDEMPESWLKLPGISKVVDVIQDEKQIPLNGADPAADPTQAQPNLATQASLTYNQFHTATGAALMILREELLKIDQGLQVVQAGLRVEVIPINRFTLPGQDTFPELDEVTRIGLEQRHDLMNARAAVMDARRIVEITANALESTLDLRIAGAVGGVNSSTKPFNFDSRASSVNVGLDFDTPVDKVAERNAYNRAQIEYQRQRRAYMALEDQIKQGIRQSWRQLKVSELQLEIDRQTVRSAATQYDNVSLQASSANQTNSLSILNALRSVLNAQNALARDWVTYERNRLNIYRDMGIMEIDPRGVWTDPFYQEQPSSPALTPDGLITPDQLSPEVPPNE